MTLLDAMDRAASMVEVPDAENRVPEFQDRVAIRQLLRSTRKALEIFGEIEVLAAGAPSRMSKV